MTNKKQKSSSKIYDLEERTFQFAKDVSLLCKTISKNQSNLKYCRQVIRSSGSIGANESLSKKDFMMRIKISRKEAKESAYWLRLLDETNNNIQGIKKLHEEAVELKKILSSMIK